MRTGVRRGLWVTAILLLIVGAVLFERLTRVTPYVRDQVVSALNARFASQVELASLQVSVSRRPSPRPPSWRAARWSGLAKSKGVTSRWT